MKDLPKSQIRIKVVERTRAEIEEVHVELTPRDAKSFEAQPGRVLARLLRKAGKRANRVEVVSVKMRGVKKKRPVCRCRIVHLANCDRYVKCTCRWVD